MSNLVAFAIIGVARCVEDSTLARRSVIRPNLFTTALHRAVPVPVRRRILHPLSSFSFCPWCRECCHSFSQFRYSAVLLVQLAQGRMQTPPPACPLYICMQMRLCISNLYAILLSPSCGATMHYPCTFFPAVVVSFTVHKRQQLFRKKKPLIRRNRRLVFLCLPKIHPAQPGIRSETWHRICGELQNKKTTHQTRRKCASNETFLVSA